MKNEKENEKSAEEGKKKPSPGVGRRLDGRKVEK
jgi:hypothetical protein